MLQKLFPRAHQRISSLPLWGPIAEGFSDWLLHQGYRRSSARLYVRTLSRLDDAFRLQGRRGLGDVTRGDLQACLTASSQDDRNLARTVHALERYFDQLTIFPPRSAQPLSRIASKLADYRRFLEELRGLGASSVAAHLGTASCFLNSVGYESNASALAELEPCAVEAFVASLGKRHGRASLQHELAHLRGFLRFGVATQTLPAGLDAHIDSPRLYRLEQLPRALPWESVCALLGSIDRSTARGLRDYAMLFVIATYGLRACDVRALRLEDIRWRQGEIHLAQRKTGQPLLLPLTDAVGDVLLGYLHEGRPETSFRELFLRVRAPLGPFKHTGVNDAFRGCVKRSGLELPFTGIHCLRHSYALHLLRQGTSLKTIGDLLGHRTAESTCVYLRLAVEDLREVALSLPRDFPAQSDQGELRP